jgi:tRNA (guanine37-N1)-methyltransferase
MWCGVITLFPQMFEAIQRYGITGRAITSGLLSVPTWDLRDFTEDKYKTVDDRPYGGGPGMVMMAKPLRQAIAQAKQAAPQGVKVVYVSPQGKRFDAHLAKHLAEKREPLLFLAGRYEGIDQRVIDQDVDDIYSVGDYILSGGELAVMVMIDALTRWIPGALGDEDSARQDSFSEENQGLLDCPHYTRPAVFEGKAVPPVLLSGDHQAIALWRKQQALGQTWLHRPDLLRLDALDALSRRLLAEFKDKLEKET